MSILMVLALFLLVFVGVLQVVLLRRNVTVDLSSVEAAIQTARQGNEQVERAVRDEIARNRDETAQAARQSREELTGTLRAVAEALGGRFEKLTAAVEIKLDGMRDVMTAHLQRLQESDERNSAQSREEASANAKSLREEVVRTLTTLGDAITGNMTQLADVQKGQLELFAGNLNAVTQSVEQKVTLLRQTVDERMSAVQSEVATQLTGARRQTASESTALREEISRSLNALSDATTRTMTEIAGLQKQQLDSFSAQLSRLTETNETKLEALKTAVEDRLKSVQEDNARQLEQMRATVDEKLQGTLEKRLGESFKQVSERLEAVSKGLGEMQTLATGVGDLKRVLTNVKTRGTWGEVQLGAMLEEVLAPDQYDANVATKQNGERVEFAVKLPGGGQTEQEVVWLPIDAKFPIEDYQRLTEAQERGDVQASEAAGKQLDLRIRQCASTICSKYLNPPKTTDFAVLFLPTEGLFAEVIRRDRLAQSIQRECRVVIAGPTTLWSILNSLQMGFKTLAIQERSSEVWNLLAAVKTEWGKYGAVLDKVEKKLREASNTVDEAARRSRAIGRKLRSVEELPAGEADSVLALNGHNGARVLVIDEEDPV
jgi:DNA recombination protein RmuC